MPNKSVYVRPILEKHDSLKLRKQGKLPSMGSTRLVYVRDEKYSWLPAKVIDKGHLSATVVISLPPDWYDKTIQPQKGLNNEERVIDLRDYIGQELPLQNFHDDESGNTVGKSDMTDLYHLHDAAILYNLRDRHYRGNPYTRVGDIMIAVNPFRWIDCLYSEETQAYYANKLIWEKVSGNSSDDDDESNSSISKIGMSKNLNNYVPLSYPPHIYETASLAYKGLLTDRRDQTILVTGESGAGKTETVKLVMSFLATLQRTHPDYESVSDILSQYSVSSKGSASGISVLEMVKRILMSNPIFEAFGNAKTIRNSNSSRFGKFTRLQFSVDDTVKDIHDSKIPNCHLIGSQYQTYLLEKSRAIKTHQGERLYHIFYQLIAAPEKEKSVIWEGLKNSSSSSFRYFGNSTIEIIDGVSDRDNWLTTIKSLYAIGIKGNSFLNLMRALCVVLQFGNLMFVPDPASPETCTLISNTDELHKLAELMGIPEVTLTIALTQRSVKASFEQIDFSLSPSDAKDGCDALAKEIYSLVFDHLVEMIDVVTNNFDRNVEETQSNTKVISLLDIFGFECFQVNRFEQLCINYANERLQQKYVSDVFQEIQMEYEEEGIQVFDFTAIDNMKILDLIEGKLGILSILNEECMLPRGNDTSFVFKVKNVNKTATPLIKNDLFAPYEFGIAHFSGRVKYDARKFVERNKDSLPADLVRAALKSQNTLISSAFSRREERIAQTQPSSKARSRKGKDSTVVSKFKAQLSGLIKNIENTRTRYIRCIKPNAEELPRVTDNLMTMNQLTSAGVTTAITIWRETYPKHLLFEQVLERFQCLAVLNMKGALDNKSKASMLLAVLFEGKYKVVGDQIITPYACGKTKVFFRSGSLELLESSRLRLFTQSSTMVQKLVRGVVARNRFYMIKKGIVTFQSQFRAKMVREDYTIIRRYIILMQSCVRKHISKTKLRKLKCDKSAIIVQKRWRGELTKRNFLRIKNASILIRRVFLQWRNKEKMKRALALLVSEARQEKITQEIQKERERLEGNFNDQISVLRKELSSLRIDLDEEKTRNVLLKSQSEDMETTSDKTKLTISNLCDKINELTQQCAIQHEENLNLQNMLKIRNDCHDEQISGFEEELMKVNQEKKDMIDDFEKEGAANEAEINNLNDMVSEVTKDHHRQTEENIKLQVLIEEIQQSHKNQLEILRNETSDAKKEKNDLVNKSEKEKTEIKVKASLLNEEISKLKEENLHQRQDNTKLNTMMQHLKKRYSKEIQDYEEQVICIQGDMEKAMDEMENDAKLSDSEISQLNKKIYELSKELNLEKEENMSLKSKIEDLHEIHNKNINQLNEKMTQIMNEKEIQIEDLDKEGASNEVEISQLNLRIAELVNEFNSRDEEHTKLQLEINEINAFHEKRANDYETRIAQIQSQYSKKIVELRKESEATEREMSHVNEKLSEFNIESNLQKRENTKLKKEMQHMQKARNMQISEYKKELENIELEKEMKINKLGENNVANEKEILNSRDKLSSLSTELSLYKQETITLKKSIDENEKVHEDHLKELEKEFITMEEEKDKLISNLRKKQTDLQNEHELELKSMKIDMLNYNSIHKTDLATYKMEMRRIVAEHEAELDRIYQLLDAAQRADLIIQSIDAHTKSANEEKVQSLRQIMERTDSIRLNSKSQSKKQNY